MSRSVKLPEPLRDWVITSLVSERKGKNLYRIVKEVNGEKVYANLYHIFAHSSYYSSDKAEFFEDEVNFLKSISKNPEFFTCFGAYVYNNKEKSKVDMYIATEELTPFSKTIKSKSFTPVEVAEFGSQMAEILAFMESKNIFHGDIRPENIFVTKDGKYKLGGFSDFENKISDFSFAAPETAKKQHPDYTTDIYSVGMIMYYLANDKKLPFENLGITRKEAITKRVNGNPISAPLNGSEMLKSVIAIACHPVNKNRWKNANNMKNALQVVIDDLTDTHSPTLGENEEQTTVIEVATTDTSIDENKVEQVEEHSDIVEISENENTSTSDDSIFVTENSVLENNENIEEKIEDVKDIKDIKNIENLEQTQTNDNLSENDTKIIDLSQNTDLLTSNNSLNDISESIFDDYEIIKPVENDVDEKSTSNDDIVDISSKYKKEQYGSFFDEAGTSNPEKIINLDKNPINFTENTNKTTNNTNHNNNSKTINKKNTDKDKKSNKAFGIIVTIISILLVLIALGFVVMTVYKKSIKPNTDVSNSTNPSTNISTSENTIATTVASTTIEPTTKSNAVKVENVVGFSFDTAKETLEKQGFKVEKGEEKYSTLYSENYVISQSISADTLIEKGSTIILGVSLGSEQATENPTDAQNNDDNNNNDNSNNNNENDNNNSNYDNSYMFYNSDSEYLSKSDLNNLSEKELEYALNEIYARRGRMFRDPSLAEYFNSKSWYEPIYSPSEFSESVFNQYEQANLHLIVEVQKEKGYR